MIRSSDFPARETELDKSVDAIAQQVVEAGFDWRKPYWRRVRGRDWTRIGRPVRADTRGAAADTGGAA